MKIAQVKTVGYPDRKAVVITSEDKPDISAELQEKWQKVLDLAAKIIGVPSGLITRLDEKDLEVFLSSRTEGNAFQPNQKFELGLGWYCESVIGTKEPLIVPDALKSDEWKDDNPSVPFNITSYMGIPIQWPDGEVFGTFCMLTSGENRYSDTHKELLFSLKEIIQDDLKSLLLLKKAQNDVVFKEIQIREIHHRIKNHFCLLISTINLQAVRGLGDKSADSVIKDIQSRLFTISMIHDDLCRATGSGTIPLGAYLNGLARHILNTFQKENVRLDFRVDSFNVSSVVSVPCGIVLNELITNSVKYAFRPAESPLIEIEIKRRNDGIVAFTYRDNGPGLPATIDFATTNSLGMMLVRQSVKQLGGSCELRRGNGFEFAMSFSIQDV